MSLRPFQIKRCSLPAGGPPPHRSGPRPRHRSILQPSSRRTFFSCLPVGTRHRPGLSPKRGNRKHLPESISCSPALLLHVWTPYSASLTLLKRGPSRAMRKARSSGLDPRLLTYLPIYLAHMLLGATGYLRKWFRSLLFARQRGEERSSLTIHQRANSKQGEKRKEKK